MNKYQKLAVLALRFAGAAIAFVGAIGPFYVAALSVLAIAAPAYGLERYLGSLAWVIVGVVLIIAAQPLGRWFGRGLD